MDVKKIGVVGAGLTGLVATKALADKGHEVEVFEKLSRPGGRMRTIEKDGWNLDVGFQVLLSAYPYLQKHLKEEKLNLSKLDAAANIFFDGKTSVVGDPFRTQGILFSTVFSNVGTLKDKWLIFKLKRKVNKLTVNEIFNLPSESTKRYLISYGFSERIISRFFRPFFSGIFLESDLKTSSRMFLFVFKMFAEGDAIIPKEGIGCLAESIMNNTSAKFFFNCEVSGSKDSTIFFDDGTKKEFDFVIDTIPAKNKDDKTFSWHSCHNFYFEHSSPSLIKTPRIGLNANGDRLVNNIFYPSSIYKSKDKEGRELLSVTVVNDKKLSQENLVKAVEKELGEDFNLSDIHSVAHFYIPIALPDLVAPLNNVKLEIKNGVLRVGDYLLNGSQNAACKIGEEAAELIDSI
jgi:protoporphyrinogen oxidase